jgi:glycyl-tRNA synthetase beta chain
LRRAAQGIVKILAESDLQLTLTAVIAAGIPDGSNPEGSESGSQTPMNLHREVAVFVLERLHFYLKDVRGFAYDVVNAVLAVGSGDVRDAIACANAITTVRDSEDFAAISAAFKRIKNILRQAEEKGYAHGNWANIDADEAKNLRSAIQSLAAEVAKLREQRKYAEALALIATLRPTVDTFFDKVMVLDPDEETRGANLALIAGVLSNFSGIADFSEIVTS